MSSYRYISHIEEEMFFINKKMYEKFRNYIAANEVQKTGNQYFVYRQNSEHFFTFDINHDKQLISKYTNTRLFNLTPPYGFETTDKITMGKTEINFNISDDYFMQDLSVQEKYLVNNRHYYSDSFIKQKKLNRTEKKSLKGKGIIGFIMDYGDKQRAFTESLQ